MMIASLNNNVFKSKFYKRIDRTIVVRFNKYSSKRMNHQPLKISSFFDPNKDERLLNITLSERSKLEHSLLFENIKAAQLMQSEKFKADQLMQSEKFKTDQLMQSERNKDEFLKDMIILLLTQITAIAFLFGVVSIHAAKIGEFIQTTVKFLIEKQMQPKVAPYSLAFSLGWFNQIGEALLKIKNISYWMFDRISEVFKKIGIIKVIK